ncbi:MAG: hypothetical protein LUF02_08340 [Erysipelotrichaceae bacterium]|nr:hypothetical protein [Erysipelotrichaceae bacterium]
MAKDEMILINMSFDSHHLDKVLMKLMDITDFYPQKASNIVFNEEVGFLDQDRSYDDLISRISRIANEMKLDLCDSDHDDILDIKKAEISLNGLEKEIKKISDISQQLQKEKHENELTLEMLKHLTSNKINFDSLQDCQYITMRLGCIDIKNKDKLSYLDKYPVIFYELVQDNKNIWCCYIVTNNYLLEVDNVFKSLGFEEVGLPDFVHGEVNDAKKELQNEVEAMQSYILNMNLKMDQLRIAHQEELLKMYATASYLTKKETYKVYVIDLKSKYSIYGFVSKDDIKDLKKHFKGIDSLEYQILPADTFEQQQIFAPRIVYNNQYVEPFELISRNQDMIYAYAYLCYGVFALFFGDLGVGAIFMLIGFLNKGKKSGRLLLALGVATILGGFVYGSIFYFMSLYSAVISFNTLFRIIDGLVLIIAGIISIRLFKDKLTFINRLSSKGIWSIAIGYIVVVYLLSLLENKILLPLVPFAIVVGVILGLIVKLFEIKKRNKEGIMYGNSKIKAFGNRISKHSI